MARLTRLLATVLLAVVFGTTALAAPASSVADNSVHSHATRNLVSVGRRGLQIESYNPPSTFETFGEGEELPASLVPLPLERQATDYIATKLNVDSSDILFRSGFSGETSRNAYVRQSHNDIPFANAVANVAFKDNHVVSFGSSFVKTDNISPSTPSITLEEFIPAVEEALDGKYNGHPTSLEYLARPDGSVALTFVAQIQNVEENKWFEAFIDAQSGELLSVVDFTADATYRVLPIEKQTLPEGLELLVDPEDVEASPNGWHFTSTGVTNNTSGNNVIAFKGSQSSLTSESSPGVFDYTYNLANAPSQQTNVNAARTNAFYVMNTIHDLTYRYGFTESAFNFQNDNFGLGGAQGDRVLMSVQDSSGTDNANFATPPDGQSGTCRMYIWTFTTPNRDGSVENSIIVHEMGHGISNRLTGGGTARCLQTTESRGLGEGWSDALAEWTEQKSDVITDYVLAPFVIDDPRGIRTFPYSTSSSTNPSRYSNVSGLSSPHRIGEIWANILHNVYAALVAQYGFSPVGRTNPGGLEGNIVFLHLFMDGLSIQPCNPTFLNARDAWIQADQNRYAGANRCLLWTAFASRGMGVGARAFVNNFAVPDDCETTE